MKCEECPFHLVCFMGRLGGKEGDERGLCPSCGKLQLLGEETRMMDANDEETRQGVIKVYKFFCELRVATPDVRSLFKQHQDQARRMGARSRGAHTIAETKTKDPVDDRLLRLSECLECCKSPLRLVAHVRVVDLDAEWEDEERRKRHVFRLRTARENQD
jgi:hypothetical protein